jgi:hypothetical protein
MVHQSSGVSVQVWSETTSFPATGLAIQLSLGLTARNSLIRYC